MNGFPLKQKRVNVNGEIFPYAPAGDTIPEIYYGKRSDDISADQEFQNMRNQFKNMIARDHTINCYLFEISANQKQANSADPCSGKLDVKW